ncbi:DUF4932 domain-containing protein [Dyadobacter sp. CY356]|uniref:DUF4932 domain-containing protein n=1 Tax=Dyadobacter sp. CY356 TaxID=2906442 RepID=UPI001F318A2A|nr:DUF4932 domain-containing protein [Dyadobacter sp. CY356]
MNIENEKGNFNGVNDIPKTFSYELGTEKDSLILSLISEQDSIAVMLKHGQQATFQIIREAKGDTATCIFTSVKTIKAAIFDDNYKKLNSGKTIIQAPEVYELINIIFSLTEYGKTGAIYKGTSYYQTVKKHFAPYASLPAVHVLDSLLKDPDNQYAPLKMDSYAFQFKGDKIEKSGVYDRVSWGSVNTLELYLPLLEAFAKKSGFRDFYKQHKTFYEGLETDFQKNINVADMKVWLEKQFPRTKYSAIKVIFSPLVGWNQSANSFLDNGFSEAQAHVNYPFVNERQKTQDPALTRGQRSMIVFTEINHSYLNPEADQYAKEIAKALKDLAMWTTQGKPAASYNNTLSCFEEYMNYGLVTLYYSDIFDKKIAENLRLAMENNMVTFRGFQKFKEFDQELLRLYQTRKPGQTVADLYPAIIAWAGKPDAK